MGTTDYDITAYQPVLYRAESIRQVVDVVGGFFRECTDESVTEMRGGVKTGSKPKAGVR
jgi:phenylalanine-4-hydroxylase